jgi:ubiquinone/menaquinone biosynthesis C-methylase UbiE
MSESVSIAAGWYNAAVLARLYLNFVNRPAVKKGIWRWWYGYLARKFRAPEWTFMNYGYAPSEGGAEMLALAEADELERQCIQLYDHVVGAVDLAGRNVLEVGSGRGGGASFLKRYKRPAQVTGVDLSKNAVEFCRARHGADGPEFRVGDAEHLPFDDGSFDVVVNVESSHCYPSFETFLSEVQRVLRPGGHFLYTDHRSQTDVESWRKALRTSGFDVLRETNITQNIVRSLDRDNDRRVELIHRIVPRFLQPSFLAFAGVRGTEMFKDFQSGKLAYMSFVLQKPMYNRSDPTQ